MKCNHCGSDFEPKQKTQKYCSRSCKKKAEKLRYRRRKRIKENTIKEIRSNWGVYCLEYDNKYWADASISTFENRIKYVSSILLSGDHPCTELQDKYNSSGWSFHFRPVVSYTQEETPFNGIDRFYVVEYILKNFNKKFSDSLIR